MLMNLRLFGYKKSFATIFSVHGDLDKELAERLGEIQQVPVSAISILQDCRYLRGKGNKLRDLGEWTLALRYYAMTRNLKVYRQQLYSKDYGADVESEYIKFDVEMCTQVCETCITLQRSDLVIHALERFSCKLRRLRRHSVPHELMGHLFNLQGEAYLHLDDSGMALEAFRTAQTYSPNNKVIETNLLKLKGAFQEPIT